MACGASRARGGGDCGGGGGGWQGMGLMAVPFPEHARDVLASLDELRRAGWLCDTQVHVSGQLFPAHRAVLAASSGYFRKLFSDEHRHGVVRLDFVEAEAFSRLLEFAYTATLTVDPSRITSLLEATHLLEFGQVASVCSDLLSASAELGNGAGEVAVPARDGDGDRGDDGASPAEPDEDDDEEEEEEAWRACRDRRHDADRASRNPPAQESDAAIRRNRVRDAALSRQRTRKRRLRSRPAGPSDELPGEPPESGHAGPSVDGAAAATGGVAGGDGGEDSALDLSSRREDERKAARGPRAAPLPASRERRVPDESDDAAEGATPEERLRVSWGYAAESGPYDAPRAPKVCQPCPICNKMIRGAGKLPRHIRTHTGERPYPCHLCGVRFTRQDKLKLHLQKHERLGGCRAGCVKPSHYGSL